MTRVAHKAMTHMFLSYKAERLQKSLLSLIPEHTREMPCTGSLVRNWASST